MLEHPVDEAPQSPPKGPEALPDEDAYYTPPGRPEALTGKGKPPAVKRFNRKMIAAVAGVGGVVVTMALAVGLQKPKKVTAPETESSTHAPMPNDSVAGLPNSYADAPPLLGEPRPGDLGKPPNAAGGTAATGSGGSPHQLSALEQYTQQQSLDHLRREDAARNSGVSFANAGSAGASSASGSDTGQGLQDKLLELAQRGGSSGAATPAAYREELDPNGQESKSQFSERRRGIDFDLHERVEVPRSPFTLFAGTILPCVLMQGINSDLPGQIGCLISQNVYDTVTGKHLLVPQGTKAIGTYDSRVAYGQSRVLVVWTRLLRPDGTTLSLEGMPGTDLSGYAGLTGHVNNHYLRLLSGVVLGSLIGATAQIATGANSQNPSFAALAAQGAGQNINEAGQQITRKNLNIQPTIEVAPGARLNIFATKDLVLPPWTE